MEPANAQWIWCPEAAEQNAYVNFAASFSIEQLDRPVLLQISVEGQYTASVNGREPAWGQYPDYPFEKVYQTHDVTEACRPGENRLFLTVYHQGKDSLTRRKAPPGVLFWVTQEERILCRSGADTRCAPERRYQNGPVELISPQLGFGFCYRADQPALPLEQYRGAQVVQKDTCLVPRRLPQLLTGRPLPAALQSQGVFWQRNESGKTAAWSAQYAALAYRELEELAGRSPPATLPAEEGLVFSSREGDGLYLLLDLGTEQSGFLKLDLELPEGTRVLVSFGEHLEDLRVRSFVDGRNFCVTYIAGRGRGVFVHRFQRLSGRYLQLFLCARQATLYEAGLVPVRYPVEDAGDFHCADHLHNQIFQVSKHTLQNCMHEHYEDCPWREQALYGLDGRLEMLCGYYLFSAYDYARENLRLLALSQREDGLLELSAPGREAITIPSFSLAFVQALADYLLYSGDTPFVRQMLPVAEGIVESVVSRIGANGLAPNYTEPAYWNFYEWQEGLDGGEIQRKQPIEQTFDAPLNAFLSLAMESMERLYGWLELPQRQEAIRRRRQRLHTAMEAFWVQEAGVYATYRKGEDQYHFAELTQALLLLCGACPQARQASLRQALAQGGLRRVTLGLSFYKYEALLQGDELRYGPFVFEEIAQTWGGMLLQGASAFWETREGAAAFHRAGSLCHGWLAIPVYFYFAYGFGIKPATPGFISYQFHPVKAGLGTIEARLRTPNDCLQGKEGVITKTQPPTGETTKTCL